MWNSANEAPAEADDYQVGWWNAGEDDEGPQFVQFVVGYSPEQGWLEYADRITHWHPLQPAPAR